MIKKITSIYVLLILSLVSVRANTQIPIRLDDYEHNVGTITRDSCFTLYIEADYKQRDHHKSAFELKINVENIDAKNRDLLLFRDNHEEWDLRMLMSDKCNDKRDAKIQPKIKFHKDFPGEKGFRKVDSCNCVKEDYIVNHSDTVQIVCISVTDYEYKESIDTIINLPIYIANHKENRCLFGKREKLIIVEKEYVELNIQVDLVRCDEIYKSIESRYKELANEVAKDVFCSHKEHKPSLKDKKDEYLSRIEVLRREILDEKDLFNWREKDDAFKPFRKLLDNLLNLEKQVNEKNDVYCRTHKQSKNGGCQYCGMDVKSLIEAVDQIHIDIATSDDIDAAKERNMKKVKAIYKCVTTHRSEVKHEDSSNIKSLYDAINQL